jgi:hypothetical protein
MENIGNVKGYMNKETEKKFKIEPKGNDRNQRKKITKIKISEVKNFVTGLSSNSLDTIAKRIYKLQKCQNKDRIKK